MLFLGGSDGSRLLWSFMPNFQAYSLENSFKDQGRHLNLCSPIAKSIPRGDLRSHTSCSLLTLQSSQLRSSLRQLIRHLQLVKLLVFLRPRVGNQASCVLQQRSLQPHVLSYGYEQCSLLVL